jgi:hypothetical protein
MQNSLAPGKIWRAETKKIMKDDKDYPICKRCNKPVMKNCNEYDVFEQMHWLCFHLEFEHDGDPDVPCGDPGCPQWHLQVFREKISQLGLNPQDVIVEAMKIKFNLDQ